MCLLVFSTCTVAASSGSFFRKKVVVHKSLSYNDVSSVILSGTIHVDSAHQGEHGSLAVLDNQPCFHAEFCSEVSWITHVPTGYAPLKAVDLTKYLIITHTLQKIS